eukprot:7512953-Karenia_brevis.AAC.1
MKLKLGLKDRQEALKKFKSETKCSDRGEIGHWVGDPECKKSKKSKFSGIADMRGDAKSPDSSETDCQCITATLGHISRVESDDIHTSRFE